MLRIADFTSPNKRLAQNALFGHFGLRKTAVGLKPFVLFFSTTFLRLLETYGFLYRNRKNVANLERYATVWNQKIEIQNVLSSNG